MLLYSSSDRSATASFRDALLGGLAPEGGLYTPVDLPRLDAAELRALRDRPFTALAARLADRLVGSEFPSGVIEALTTEALDFPAPTVELESNQCVLELFHGPTLAFKDFGSRFLAHVFGYLLRERGDSATVLVATSGDTGGAVAHGFHGVPHVEVVVLYPAAKVSAFQEAQMASLGGNVQAVRVPGTFDDCQRLVKAALRDPGLADMRLSSANSINIGRLLPQMFYYVASYLAVTGGSGDPVIFSVPCGNLGNLTAGVLASRLGVPVKRFIAAVNRNTVVPEYLETGVYRPRPSIGTSSSAMDVGHPSNLARLLALYDNSRDALAADVWSTSVGEADTRETMRRVWDSTGYLFDPHGAVGRCAADRYREHVPGPEPVVTLATAHPAKFSDLIEATLNLTPDLPEAFKDWRQWPIYPRELGSVEYQDEFRQFLHRQR